MISPAPYRWQMAGAEFRLPSKLLHPLLGEGMPCTRAMSEFPKALKLWLWVDCMFLDLLICLVRLLL